MVIGVEAKMVDRASRCEGWVGALRLWGGQILRWDWKACREPQHRDLRNTPRNNAEVLGGTERYLEGHGIDASSL
jgi:hypothetical protein